MYYVNKEMMSQLNTAKFKKTPRALLNEILDETCGSFSQISYWYFNSDELSAEEAQAKIIQHIWLNEPQFELEKPKKYLVQALDNNNEPWYITENSYGIKGFAFCVCSSAFRFDTREEAEEYSTPQAEIIEVED